MTARLDTAVADLQQTIAELQRQLGAFRRARLGDRIPDRDQRVWRVSLAPLAGRGSG